MQLSVIEIRNRLLADLRTEFPDWVLDEGEIPVDILDFCAQFHYDREFIIDLFESMRNIVGFERLIYDTEYRQSVADVLKISLVSRTADVVFRGVPQEITNDVDAFIFYYMDRVAEKYGRSRRRGSGASAKIDLVYTVGLSGSVRILFNAAGLPYVANFVLDGSGAAVGLVVSFGYGSRFNQPENSLQLRSVVGSITSSDVISFSHTTIAGGSDYQSNEGFYQELSSTAPLFSGPLSKNALSYVISTEPSVDAFLIAPLAPGERFIGSTNIYIKGGVRELWYADKTVLDDYKVLVPYQPSSLQSVALSGTVVSPSDYTVEPPISGDVSVGSTEQLVYVNFDVGSRPVAKGDVVRLELLVNKTVQSVHARLNNHYSSFYEAGRDFRVYEALESVLDVRATLLLYQPLDQITLDSLMRSSVSRYLSRIPIQSDIDADDLREPMRSTTLSGRRVIDSINSLEIRSGGAWTSGRLTALRGHYWVLNTSIFTVV